LKCYSISFLGEWCSGSGHGNSKKQAMLIKKRYLLYLAYSHIIFMELLKIGMELFRFHASKFYVDIFCTI